MDIHCPWRLASSLRILYHVFTRCLAFCPPVSMVKDAMKSIYIAIAKKVVVTKHRMEWNTWKARNGCIYFYYGVLSVNCIELDELYAGT